MTRTAPADATPDIPADLATRKWYVLAVLFLAYTFNFLDRQVLVILAQPIKLEFGLKDWQLGFLTGTAFALFYATFGIPIARLADRWNRVNILAAALTLWSAMTSLSAATTSFAQLAWARVGVGIGEAGGSPPAVSLLSNYFPRAERATAMAIYSLGVTIGILLGFVVGGWINQSYGWRAAMLVAGLPGLVLALVVKLTVIEPRARLAAGRTAPPPLPSIRETVRTLYSIRACRILIVAAVASGTTLNGFIAWVPVYLIREFHLGTREAGTSIGLTAGIAGSIGVFCAGWLADRLARRDPRWHLWVPAVTTLLFPVAIWFVLHAKTAAGALGLLVPTYLVALAYTGPTWAMLQTVAPPNMRAMAAAILLFLLNSVGLGLGPQLIGILSDVLTPAYGAGALRIAIAVVCCGSIAGSVSYYIGASALAAGGHAST